MTRETTGDLEQLEAIAREYVDSLGRQELDRALALWRPGGIDHFPGIGDFEAPGEVETLFGDLYGTVEDYGYEIQSVTVQDDRAVVLWRMRGSFSGTGNFIGLAPNGRSFDMEGVDVLTIRDGRIVHNTSITNMLEMTRQLGLLPPQHSRLEKTMFGLANLVAPLAKSIRSRRKARR